MTRAFRPEPLPAGTIEELVDLASRAPSAGKTQGWHVVVLEGDETRRYWDLTLPAERRDGFRWQHLLDAPVLLLPLADPGAYVERYGEADKARTGLGLEASAWSAPYWTIDASMAVMTLLLAAEDRGIGALFFGVFAHTAAVCCEFDIPDDLQLLGAIALGHPLAEPPNGATSQGVGAGRSASRSRRSPDEIIHQGRFRAGSRRR